MTLSLDGNGALTLTTLTDMILQSTELQSQYDLLDVNFPSANLESLIKILGFTLMRIWPIIVELSWFALSQSKHILDQI